MKAFKIGVVVACLFLVGCATQTKSVEQMYITTTEAGYPVTIVGHAEKIENGLHITLGRDAALGKIFLGSENLLLNWTLAPLGADSFIWEHINAMNADASGADGAIRSRTLIRIDEPKYLGPLQ